MLGLLPWESPANHYGITDAPGCFKVKDHRGQIVYTMPHGHKDEEKRLVAVRFAKTLGGELNIAPESAKKTIWKHNEDAAK